MNMPHLSILAASFVAVLTFAGCKWPCCCSCDSTGSSKKNPVAQQAQSTPVQAIESWEAFEKQVLQATKPVVADFYTTWCGACKELKPIFEKTAKELADKYTFVSINVNVVEKAAQEYGIRGVPTIIFFKDGKAVDADKWIVGSTSDDQLKAAIETAFGK